MTRSNTKLLHHTFEIYLPTLKGNGTPIPGKTRNAIIADVKAKMCDWFGGVTQSRSKGQWPASDEWHREAFVA